MKIPLITYHTGSTVDGYSGKYLRKFTLLKAKWIFASGDAELNRLKAIYKISLNCSNIIRPPIDYNIYKPGVRKEACKATGLSPDKRYWMFVGRMDDTIKRII